MWCSVIYTPPTIQSRRAELFSYFPVWKMVRGPHSEMPMYCKQANTQQLFLHNFAKHHNRQLQGNELSRAHAKPFFAASILPRRLQIEAMAARPSCNAHCQNYMICVSGISDPWDFLLRMFDRLAVIIERERRAFVVHNRIARIRQLMFVSVSCRCSHGQWVGKGRTNTHSEWWMRVSEPSACRDGKSVCEYGNRSKKDRCKWMGTCGAKGVHAAADATAR